MAKEWLTKTIWQPVWLMEIWEENPLNVLSRWCHVIPLGNTLEYNDQFYSLRPMIVSDSGNNPTVILKSPVDPFTGQNGMKLIKVEESGLQQGGRDPDTFDSDALLFMADYWVVGTTNRTDGDVEIALNPYYKTPKKDVVRRRCPWTYRGPRENGRGCGYTGAAAFDANNESVTQFNRDVCNKSIEACNLRFPEENLQPFGGAEVTYGGKY